MKKNRIFSRVLSGALAGALALVAVADAREVGQQGVGPHVGHVAFVEGQRHAPVEGGTTPPLTALRTAGPPISA